MISSDYKKGFITGIPIGLGYLPVSFTFGLMAVQGGIPVWLAVFISFSNLTSAGQFAGTTLILADAGYLEIILTTFVINLRYMLMSLSLSQKLNPEVSTGKRLFVGFGITDEIFALASLRQGKISAAYMYGLMTTPIFGWTLGTFLGACTSAILPDSLQNAMGIALYTMFIAIIIPTAKKSKAVRAVIALSIIITCILKYTVTVISPGFQVIIATLVSAAVMAVFVPVKDEQNHGEGIGEERDKGCKT